MSKGTLTIPEGLHHIEPTPREQLDAAISEVRARRKDWVDLDLQARIDLLDRMIDDTYAVSRVWGERAAAAKGIPEESRHRGEDLGTGPYIVIRIMRLLKQTLEEIRDHGEPQVELRTRPDGQVVADVFPVDVYDKLLVSGVTAEVRLQEHVGLEEARNRMARIYRPGGKDEGGVCLVLGAGNVSSIPTSDVLYKLFVKDRVCVLKMNPVNEHLGPLFHEAFRALIEADYLRIVYGGANEGQYLTEHGDVDEIHITGSDKTHDVIVFGPGDEGEYRKENNEPKLDKKITSELGNVSPVIVVPGPWSDTDVAFHGDNIASQLVMNAGFYCLATRAIVTHRAWARRRDLLDAVRDSLRRAEHRVPYYPGAEDRWRSFVTEHPEAERFGEEKDGQVPWTLIPDVDPSDTEDVAFTTEAFCGVFAEAPIDAPRSVPEYIDAAVEFCNETLWGTLDANIIVHPRSLADPAIETAVERAVDNLRYGSVAVNVWVGLSYAIGSTSWGAYPGHELTDIQSGRGVVHNTYMLEDVEKAVIRGPFRPPVKPTWFHTHERMRQLSEKMIEFEATGSKAALPAVVWHGIRG